MTQTRRLKLREVEIGFVTRNANLDTIHLSEVNNFDISYDNQIGTEEGLHRNFIKDWRLGIITIKIKGRSYIGAFLPEENIDRIDNNVKRLSYRFETFIDSKINQKAELWIDRFSGEGKRLYVGFFSDFNYTETSQSPYLINYNMTFKCSNARDRLKEIEEQARFDKADKWFTRANAKQLEKQREEDIQEYKNNEADKTEKTVTGIDGTRSIDSNSSTVDTGKTTINN